MEKQSTDDLLGKENVYLHENRFWLAKIVCAQIIFLHDSFQFADSCVTLQFNLFHVTDLFLCLLKTSEN